jgi:hypothetical protein
MDEIAGLRARSVFATRAPVDFADRQNIGDGLLLSMMMDAGTSSRFDLEQPTPTKPTRCRGYSVGPRLCSQPSSCGSNKC